MQIMYNYAYIYIVIHHDTPSSVTVTCNLRVPVYTPLVSYGDIIPYITNAGKCTVIVDTLKLLEKG